MTSPRGAAPARVTHNGMMRARSPVRAERRACANAAKLPPQIPVRAGALQSLPAITQKPTRQTVCLMRPARARPPGGGTRGRGGVTVSGGGRLRSRASTPARKTAVHVGGSWGLPPRRRGVGMVSAAGAVDRSRRRRGAQESRRFTMKRRTSV